MKTTPIWCIAIEDEDNNLMTIGAPDRFHQWIIQVVVFEYQDFIKSNELITSPI